MEQIKVSGKNNKHKVVVYALSTCVWCKMTKELLKKSNVEYIYVDVDLCNDEDKAKIIKEVQELKGRLGFPITIIDDQILINGFQENQIREALGV